MGVFSDLEKQLTPEALSGPEKDRAAWLDGYQEASFRGVPFFIQTAENNGGRRIKSHLFPGRDDVYHEDLGRAERNFRFSAYIVNGNYADLRERLIEALEKEGPGRLVHPYRGVFEVVCKSFTARESTPEGRMVRFDLDFSEQKIVELTTATNNTELEVAVKKSDFLDDLLSEFEAAYNIAGMAVSGVQDALNAIDRVLNVIEAAKKVVSSISEFQRELSNIRGKLIQFAFDVTDLGNTLLGLVNFGTNPDNPDAPATAENAMEQLREMSAIYEAMQINATNTAPEIYNAPDYAANQIQVLTAQAAVGGAVGLSAVVEYETIEQALEVRAEIFQLLDLVMSDPVTPDTVYESARAAKAAIVEDLDRKILNVSSLVDFTIPETSNTLHITNEVYGEISKEKEIIERNNILNPFFVSAAAPLKVAANV